jgi:hypothetical protein
MVKGEKKREEGSPWKLRIDLEESRHTSLPSFLGAIGENPQKSPEIKGNNVLGIPTGVE